jgi:hypothetical protein
VRQVENESIFHNTKKNLSRISGALFQLDISGKIYLTQNSVIIRFAAVAFAFKPDFKR